MRALARAPAPSPLEEAREIAATFAARSGAPEEVRSQWYARIGTATTVQELMEALGSIAAAPGGNTGSAHRILAYPLDDPENRDFEVRMVLLFPADVLYFFIGSAPAQGLIRGYTWNARLTLEGDKLYARTRETVYRVGYRSMCQLVLHVGDSFCMTHQSLTVNLRAVRDLRLLGRATRAGVGVGRMIESLAVAQRHAAELRRRLLD